MIGLAKGSFSKYAEAAKLFLTPPPFRLPRPLLGTRPRTAASSDSHPQTPLKPPRPRPAASATRSSLAGRKVAPAGPSEAESRPEAGAPRPLPGEPGLAQPFLPPPVLAGSLQRGAVGLWEHGVGWATSSPPTLPSPRFSFRWTQFRGEGAAACTRGPGGRGRKGRRGDTGWRQVGKHTGCSEQPLTPPAPNPAMRPGAAARPARMPQSPELGGGSGGGEASLLLSGLHLQPTPHLPPGGTLQNRPAPTIKEGIAAGVSHLTGDDPFLKSSCGAPCVTGMKWWW